MNKNPLEMNSLNTRLRKRDEKVTREYIEAKKRRVREAKEEVLYLERRLSMAKDRLMIVENELSDILWYQKMGKGDNL